MMIAEETKLPTLIDARQTELMRLEEQYAGFAGKADQFLRERLAIERQIEDADLGVDEMTRLMARLPALEKLRDLNKKRAERLIERLRFARETLKDLKAEPSKIRERLIEIRRELPSAKASEETARLDMERMADLPHRREKTRHYHAKAAAELRKLEEEDRRLKSRYEALVGEVWQAE